jgi:APA family basic amino acid/polyamine antiporter
MAREGLFFRLVGRVDPDRHTPKASLVLQAVWSSALVFSGTYDQIFTYVIFVSWIFYGLAGGAVILLRLREPGTERPYRAWGYPWSVLIFITAAVALTVNTIASAPREAAIGLGVMATGIPAYLWWSRRGRPAEPAVDSRAPGS